MAIKTIDLGDGVVFAMTEDMHHVETRIAGRKTVGTRDDTEENSDEAADQGYSGPNSIWESLRDHELLHTLLSRRLFGHESYVVRHEAGLERARYALRLYEEAVVVSFQYWLNTGLLDQVLLWVPQRVLKEVRDEHRQLVAQLCG